MSILRTLFLVAALTATLCGCYATDEPVLDKGEWAPFAGTFTCKSMMGNETTTLTERKNGFIFADYAYAGPKGEDFKFKKLKDTLYLAQITDKQGSIGYIFIDFKKSDGFIMLIPDIMSKAPYIQDLMKKSGIVETQGKRRNEPGLINLGGGKSAVLAFLSAHDLTVLSAMGECSKKA